MSTTRTQRRYDHRLRQLVQTTGDIDLATRHGVPRSTARCWLTKATAEVMSLDVLDLDTVRTVWQVEGEMMSSDGVNIFIIPQSDLNPGDHKELLPR